MEKIENKIAKILNRYPETRKFYRKYINLPDETIFLYLDSYVKIQEKRNKVENIKLFDYAINQYFSLLDLNPYEVWKRIEYKNLTEIRMDVEEIKREMKISGRKKIGKNADEVDLFKMNSRNSGADFERGFDRLDLRI